MRRILFGETKVELRETDRQRIAILGGLGENGGPRGNDKRISSDASFCQGGESFAISSDLTGRRPPREDRASSKHQATVKQDHIRFKIS